VFVLGFSAAGAAGSPLPFRDTAWRALYAADRLTPGGDIAMSARTIAWLLGGDPATGDASVPDAYRRILREAASGALTDAWSLRARLDDVARASFWPPSFHPLATAGD
jgi:hypothetical protein